MSVRLETLELTPAELAAAREAIQKIAYFNWLAAGSPAGQDAEFWGQAEPSGSSDITCRAGRWTGRAQSLKRRRPWRSKTLRSRRRSKRFARERRSRLARRSPLDANRTRGEH